MKISYNWLKTYLDFPYSASELSEILTQTGLEVEGIEAIHEIQGGLEGVVIGEVLTCEKHPDADKLKVTTVDIGAPEPLQIVCGAPNVATGQKVVVATVGCTLYPKPDEAFEIKKAKIRGVSSAGMLCAEDELGLGESHEGIMVLPDEAIIGQAAAAYFKLANDIQLEIGLTPNRADAMGHIGVARDIKAKYNLDHDKQLELIWPQIPSYTNAKLPVINIQIEDQEACKKYLAIEMNQVKVGTSPKWLQNRLKAVGIKPINNVVDISNFIQRELGTPLHIFDADQTGYALEVRRAATDETFLGLDQQKYKLAGHELVIANENGPLCLAGILGGLESGVSQQTTRILIESALFDAVSIRKAARQHGLNTDASFRFERGVDPDLTHMALYRCIQLLQEICGAQINSSTFEFIGNTAVPIRLNLSALQLNTVIGNELPINQVEQILKDLDFKIHGYTKDCWDISIPTYRVDVTRPIDVIEEILRIYGLNNIKLPAKWSYSPSAPITHTTTQQKAVIAEFLVGRGFYEVMNNSLSKKQYSTMLDNSFGTPISMLNPLSQDLANLRQSLLFGLLENIAYNQNRQQSDLQFFEFGQDYQTHQEQHLETPRLAIAIVGKQDLENWNDSKTTQHSFFSLQKEVNAVIERFGLSSACIIQSKASILFKQGMIIECDRKILVELGEVSTDIRLQFDIKQPVYYAQINWDLLIELAAKRKIQFREVPKSFAVRRDLSLLIDQNISYQDLEICARKAETKILKDVQLFDVYEGKNLPAGKKSYALAFYLQDAHQTLSEVQIEKAMQRILSVLERDCAAQLRA